MKDSLLAFALLAAHGEDFPTSAGAVKITPIQHASFLLEAAGKTLYVDPAMGDYAGRPKADYILITDIHGDHGTAGGGGQARGRGRDFERREESAGTVSGGSDPDVQPEARAGARQALPRQRARQRLRPGVRRQALLQISTWPSSA